jgi:hypothetical protein
MLSNVIGYFGNLARLSFLTYYRPLRVKCMKTIG